MRLPFPFNQSHSPIPLENIEFAVSEGNGGGGEEKVRTTETDSEIGEVEIEPAGDKSYAGERVREKTCVE